MMGEPAHSRNAGKENAMMSQEIHRNDNQCSPIIIPTKLTSPVTSNKVKKSKKKGVFLSYSCKAPYEERKFVIELSKQLNEIGMHDDVWFDRDVLQGSIMGPFLISSRLEVAEKCRAAIIVLSESYFVSHQTRSEGEIFLKRIEMYQDATDIVQPIRLLVVKFSDWFSGADDGLSSLSESIAVNLSVGKISRLSEAEKVSMFISVLNKELEEISNGFSIKIPKTIDDNSTLLEYKSKPLLAWTVKDVQDWLASLKIHEKYIISFEEFEIDGFLLQSVTDDILSNILAVDSQICRRKILQKVKLIIDEEIQTGRFDEWSKKRTIRIKSNSVYLIHDPDDAELSNLVKLDLEQKKLQVLSHSKLGQSKEEFLKANAHAIASSSRVIFLFTSRGANSPFAFYETVFAVWLGRPLIVAVFENCFDKMKLSLSAILSDVPAIDFASTLYLDGLDLLVNEIMPPRAVSGVIFEQKYLRRVAEGVCQFREIAGRYDTPKDIHEQVQTPVSTSTKSGLNLDVPKVFVSYQWDHQSRVKTIINSLKAASFRCWSDLDRVTRRPVTQSLPRTTPLATSRMSAHDNLANEIEKNIKDSCVVVICVSPSYLQSANCLKEVSTAAFYNKPIIAVLLRWLAWPPDSVSYTMRRIFAAVKCVDLSNDKLFARNLPSLTSHILRVTQIKLD